MKHRLISVALVTILLFMILGNSIGCGGGGTQYTLTITSTAGGNVTDPGEGTFTYDAGMVVELVATPDSGYQFVNWTGDVSTIGSVDAPTTIMTMNGNYTITANFGVDAVIIGDVPDANQPPTNTLPTPNPTNFCAPIAMANVLEYWDDVMNHANAQNVTAGLIPETVAEYIGWFMDTNNNGSPDRGNGVDFHSGTYNKDIGPGTLDFVRWDATHPPTPPRPVTAPNFTLPAGKLGYNWIVGWNCDTDYNLTLSLYKNDIDNGLPMVVTFDFWNPVFKMNVTDPETGETISVHDWGDPKWYSSDPVESWMTDIGHAVTGVGYILNWDPDGAGPIPSVDWVIVHDNWASTPENVAIPWAWWTCLYNVNPNA
jgi:uncharacterized repeat protein (TIGR02543 family)